MTKIIHCDADCFYAAIEMRDDPNLRAIPLAIGGSKDRRGVISTCNYEARRFGVKSAMSSAEALRLCPGLTLIPGNMAKYKEASSRMRDIFFQYTDLVEPLSLDEAYLDVSNCSVHSGSATLIAQEIRQKIKKDVGITVSAGVAPSKFLAKIASDWKKPDGLFVITPKQVEDFVKVLPVGKIHGVGKVTEQKLQRFGIAVCDDIYRRGLPEMVKHFGTYGKRLFELSQGVDSRDVTPHRIRQSLSVEHTFAHDLSNEQECLNRIPPLLEELTARLEKSERATNVAKAFVKVKFNDFTSTTLERVGCKARISDYYSLMKEAVNRKHLPVRLLGLGVRFIHSQSDARQLELFPV